MTNTIKPFDVIALIVDLPQYKLWRGQVGTVVKILMRRLLRMETYASLTTSSEDYFYPADYFVLIDLLRKTGRILNKSFEPGVQHPS